MSKPQIDYAAVFENLPVPCLLLTPDYVMIDANPAYEQITGRSRDQLAGQSVFDAFPDNPSEPAATGTLNLNASLRRAAETGERDVMALQRYDVEVPGHPGVFTERYWCPVNVPVMGSGGELTMLVHVVEEVSDLIAKFVEAEAARA
jgi:PAS domain S-box-containing protein